jgi:hypothetical protein
VGWTGQYPSPELYGPFATCNPDVSPISVWTNGGVLMGNLCTSKGLVRFPTACGGFVELPINEPFAAAEGQPLPSTVIERVQDEAFELVWSEGQRSAIELTITSSELACYELVGYDETFERDIVTSITALQIAVSVDDDAIAFVQDTTLIGSYGYLDDEHEGVARTRACKDLESDEISAVNERLETSLQHVLACLTIIMRQDERLEVSLELARPMAVSTIHPQHELDVIKRLLVLEVGP